MTEIVHSGNILTTTSKIERKHVYDATRFAGRLYPYATQAATITIYSHLQRFMTRRDL